MQHHLIGIRTVWRGVSSQQVVLDGEGACSGIVLIIRAGIGVAAQVGILLHQRGDEEV